MRLVIFTGKTENPKIIRLPRWSAALALLAFLLSLLPAVYVYRERVRLTGEIGRAEQRERELREGIRQAEGWIGELQARLAKLSPQTARTSGGASPETGQFVVQVSAHRDSAEAAISAEHLMGLVQEAVRVAAARLPNGLWYRVLAGSFASEEAARAWADSLRRTGVFPEYNIRRLEPDTLPEN